VSYDLDSFAQALHDKIEPMTLEDEKYNYALAKFLAAFGVMFQDIDDLVAETDDGPPWSVALDLDRIPSVGLGWLAQFIGVSLDPRLSDADQRIRIKTTDGFNRGTPAALKGAAAGYLTGNKTVVFRERFPDAYSLTVVTYTSETPDSAKVLSALLDQKPAGLKLTYSVLAGQDYQSLYTNHATYSNVKTTYATYQGIVTEQPGT
jgi:hypothetical protein